MRTIDPQLKTKFESALQTAAANADPGAVIWLSRPTVALTDPEFLERKAAGVTTGLTAVDVAMRRTRANREPDRAFVAYISAGTAGVRSGALTTKIDDMIFTQESFSVAADDVAVAFDGRMISAPDGTAQFVTDERPWIFWCSGGVLKGRILGMLGDTELAAANCTKVTAIRATGGARDFGLVVFFLLNGAIYYRQLINGEWKDAAAVTFGPSGVTWADIAAFRTWDYRVSLQAVTTGGDVYELFTQFQGLGRHGEEHVTLQDVASTLRITAISEYSAKARDEHVNLAAASVGVPYRFAYEIGPVSFLGAENVADGADWGRIVACRFDKELDPDLVAANIMQFSLIDSETNEFIPERVEMDGTGRVLRLIYTSFNNAIGALTVSYTPGTIASMYGAALGAFSATFTPTGLVPADLPELTDVYNE